MKQKTLEFLETHKSETSSTWREEAEWRRENWSWLRHSQMIAVKVLLQMKLLGLTGKFDVFGPREVVSADPLKFLEIDPKNVLADGVNY